MAKVKVEGAEVPMGEVVAVVHEKGVSSPTAATVAEPEKPAGPSPAEAWLTAFRAVLAELDNGVLRRLAALADSIPTDDPAAFWRLFAEVLNTFEAADSPQPAEAARVAATGVRFTRQASGSVVRVVESLLERAAGLIAKGVNDAADPWICVNSIPNTLVSGGVRLAFVTNLPAHHPLLDVRPVGSGLDAAVVLGPASATWTRKSRVAKWTAERRPPEEKANPKIAADADKAFKEARVRALEQALADARMRANA